MTRGTCRQAGLTVLAAALIERLEDAEHLAIRSVPKTSRASRLHTAQLRQATADAATLAAAIEILVERESKVTARTR